MIQKKHLCAAVALALVSGSTFATNGYFAHGYGTKNKGMAGAGVALPQDAMTIATNPAGLTEVGTRLDIGAALFAPIRSYTAGAPTGPGANVNGDGTEVDSGRELFLVPHFAYSQKLDANSSVGIAVFGNGGMNTKYSAGDTPGGAGTFGNPVAPFYAGNAGVDLMQLFIAPTYARKLTDNVSVGVSAILAYQRFKAYGLSGFAAISSDAANVSDNGYDDSFGYGGRLGLSAQVSSDLTLGASYQSRVYMSKLDKYAGLFAEQGDFDIPANFTICAAFKATPALTLTADVQRIMYSDIASISNPGGGPGVGPLGADNGAGFGWDDITVVKIGAQYQLSNATTLRAGFSKGESPFDGSQVVFNILAPATIEQHFTAGLTHKLNNSSELSVAAMYAPEKSVSGNPTGDQNVEVKMHQFELEVSYGMTW